MSIISSSSNNMRCGVTPPAREFRCGLRPVAGAPERGLPRCHYVSLRPVLPTGFRDVALSSPIVPAPGCDIFCTRASIRSGSCCLGHNRASDRKVATQSLAGRVPSGVLKVCARVSFPIFRITKPKKCRARPLLMRAVAPLVPGI